MIIDELISESFHSQKREVNATVELYNGSTLVDTFKESDRIVEITIERVGEDSKFFGFGVCQKLNVKLIDLHKELDITTDNSFKVYFNGIDAYPRFYVTEVNRDETTNELSITAYDVLEKAVAHTISEMCYYAPIEVINCCSMVPSLTDVDDEIMHDQTIVTSYNTLQFVSECAYILDLDGFNIIGVDDKTCFQTFYEAGANFDATETIRDALTWVSEVTQTVYYIDSDNKLILKRPDRDGEPVYTIDKSMYTELDTKTNKRLGTIFHVTELGDDVYASLDETGSTQYVRDNPFWDLRDDIATLVDNAFTAMGGITINQFDCEWRGNPCLEICDKIAMVTKDGSLATSFVFDDVITYNGALSEHTQWNFNSDDSETADNPTSLGDVIKQTYARVDKANQEITLWASKTEGNIEEIASIQLNTESINQSVERVEKNTKEIIDGIEEDIGTLTQKVESAMTAEEVVFTVKEQLEQTGVSAITTETGFVFDKDGLNISKSDSEMSTLISEDGMTISKDGDVILKADNTGVVAKNLHAETYLLIGLNSRFEDYTQEAKTRTGCFWVGK